MAREAQGSRWQNFAIVPTGGLNLDENPNAVRQGEIIEALNVWYRGNTIGTRPGAQFETEAGGYTAVLPGAVQGAYEWVRNNGSTRNLIAIANGTIYVDGTPTAITEDPGPPAVSVTAGSTRRWTFAQFGYSGTSRVFAAGNTGTDTPWYWPGTGNAIRLAITDSGGTNLVLPSFIYAKWKRLYACGWRDAAGALSTDIAADPMTPRYSALNDPLTWPIGNTFAGTGIGGLPAYGDEYLTGFSEFTDNTGDWLLLLTNKTLYAVSEDPTKPVVPFYISRTGGIGFGCVAQQAFVSLGLDSGDAVYLSSAGIHSIRQTQNRGGSERETLSWKIRRLFRTINHSQIHLSCGAYLREEGLVVFAVPTGSDTFNSLLLVLDMKSKDQEEVTSDSARWTAWRLSGPTASHRKVTVLLSAKSSSGKPYLYGGNEAGAVFRFDESVATDFGTPYGDSFATRWEDYGDATRDKTMGDVYVQAQPGGGSAASLRMTARFNFGGQSTGPYLLSLPVQTGGHLGVDTILGTWRLGAGRVTNSQRSYVTGHGMNVSLRFQRNASDPYYIAGIYGRVAGSGPAAEVA